MAIWWLFGSSIVLKRLEDVILQSSHTTLTVTPLPFVPPLSSTHILSAQHVTTAAWRLLQLLQLLLQWRHGVSLLLHEPASEVESQLLAAGQQRIAIPIWMLHQCHTYYILWHSQLFLITIDISFWYNHLQMSSDRIFDPQTGLTFPELPSPLTPPWISLASAKSSSAWWKSLWIPQYIFQMWM